MRFTAISQRCIKTAYEELWLAPVLMGMECSPSPAMRKDSTPKGLRDLFQSVLPKLWQRYCAGVVLRVQGHTPERDTAFQFMRSCYMPHVIMDDETSEERVSMDMPGYVSTPTVSSVCQAFLRNISVIPKYVPNKPVSEWKLPGDSDEEMAKYVDSLFTDRLFEPEPSSATE